jgi:acetolactate synthase I/III small subunit
MEQIIAALVEDKPGVLQRVTQLFRRKMYNIKSLTVGQTEQPGISRLTVVVDSTPGEGQQLMMYLYKLINVITCEVLTDAPYVNRDLMMVKVRVTPANRTEVMLLVDVYRGKIVDVGQDSLIVEVTGDSEKIESFVQVLRPFGIIEVAHTGLVAMTRGSASLNIPNPVPAYLPAYQI